MVLRVGSFCGASTFGNGQADGDPWLKDVVHTDVLVVESTCRHLLWGALAAHTREHVHHPATPVRRRRVDSALAT
jgi:hypothetical protein